MRWFFVVLTAASLTLPGPAAAQVRRGFWLNAGLGYGSQGCADCIRDDGLSGDFALGGTLSPRVQVGLGSAGWLRNYSSSTATIATLDARVRFYPSPTGNLYLTGGLGLGALHIDRDDFGSSTKTGVGAVVGVGYDIRMGSSVSLTPYLTGFGVRVSGITFNIGQVGLSVTIHKFTQPPAATPAPEAVPTYEPAMPPARQPAAAPPDTAEARPSPSADPTERTAWPAGTQIVGDTRLMLYYPAACAARKAIPPKFQVLFQSAAGAERDGFKPSGDC
jgi:hypothetical protein